MPTIFWKNLLKCLPTATTSSNPLNVQQERNHLMKSATDPTVTVTTATATGTPNPTTTTIMIKNLSSLYDLPSASTSKTLSTHSTYSSSSDSDSDTESPPDFAAIFASQRFFFSSPGLSNSIIESPETLPESESEKKLPVTGSVAVKKYSPDPYTDFKNSMQEMIEARNLKDVRGDWDYLHELLSCYLTLNPKHTHKFIISAFADLIISLLSSSSSSESDILQTPVSGRRHNVSHWLV